MAIDCAQLGKFVGVVRIVKLFADRPGFVAQTLVEFLPAFGLVLLSSESRRRSSSDSARDSVASSRPPICDTPVPVDRELGHREESVG